MDRSDVVRRAAQKVVRAGYVVRSHRVARGSYLGALFFDKSLRLKNQTSAKEIEENIMNEVGLILSIFKKNKGGGGG
jgi:hypothetical protein